MLMKETEDDTKKWKDIRSWIERTNVVKMSILPKATYRFIYSFLKILFIYMTEREHERAEGEGEAGSPLSRKLDAGLDPKIMT